MKLYSGPLSLFTAKVRIALAEKALPHDRIEVGWSLERRYAPHHPDVVALSPKRQVPVLVDGDVVVWDSTLILEYLEERHPEPPLLPTGLADRARCRQLETAADEIVFPTVWELIDAGFHPDQRDDQRLEAARARMAEHHAWLDRELEGRAHLCGEAFSWADIGMIVMLGAAASLGAPAAPEHRQLGRWLESVGRRPAVAEDQAAMLAFVASLQPAAGEADETPASASATG